MAVLSASNFTMVLAVAFWSTAALAAAQQNIALPASWSGVIINANCTAEEAFAEAAKCTEKGADAKLGLYDDTTRQVFKLDPQNQVAGHLGDSVTVEGVLKDDTLHVHSVKLLTGIGLPVGERAPAVSAPDQFGGQQTLDTLKGPNGTVILFFRSADW